MRCLNAPYGARCFLTDGNLYITALYSPSLNAPYGAWGFLTASTQAYADKTVYVLMHLMALGAF